MPDKKNDSGIDSILPPNSPLTTTVWFHDPDAKPGDPTHIDITRNGDHITITKRW